MGMQLKCSMYYVKSFIVLLETGILKDELVSLKTFFWIRARDPNFKIHMIPV